VTGDGEHREGGIGNLQRPRERKPPNAETVEATVRILQGQRVRQETRRWSTTTGQIQAMADWLATHGVTHAGMESTGVFWKPIFNILETRFTVILTNPAHMKQVPGRKSDLRDSQWGAQLLQAGLLRGSFIPPRWQRELRDYTRYRSQLQAEQTRVANRLHKVLEDANIKLGSVATDILGLSGRAMIHALMGLVLNRRDRDLNRVVEVLQKLVFWPAASAEL